MVRGRSLGEIVEVEGGHIVRSTGRKDRHSKVCTAKGPRDRRVRLAAHTAIQFYDVQDRLGFDRPSKAVDWLINKAKASIDQLAHLPPWNPNQHQQQQPQNDAVLDENPQNAPDDDILPENQHDGSGFVPLENDAVRSFFPATTSSLIQFHSYPPDLLSRTSSQDLRLSLQSFQQHDPILLHQNENEHVLFSGTTPFGFDGMVAWNHNTGNNNSSGGGGGGDGGGFVFNASPSQAPAVFFGQSQYFSSQRGPLQSSNTQSVRAWVDAAPSFASPALVCPSSASGVGFAHGGFSGFRVPAQIQGEEEHGGVSDKPSSASSDSRR